jgi:hypothetical protein
MSFFLTGRWGSTVAPLCSRGGGGAMGCFPSSIVISAGRRLLTSSSARQGSSIAHPYLCTFFSLPEISAPATHRSVLRSVPLAGTFPLVSLVQRQLMENSAVDLLCELSAHLDKPVLCAWSSQRIQCLCAYVPLF